MCIARYVAGLFNYDFQVLILQILTLILRSVNMVLICPMLQTSRGKAQLAVSTFLIDSRLYT